MSVFSGLFWIDYGMPGSREVAWERVWLCRDCDSTLLVQQHAIFVNLTTGLR